MALEPEYQKIADDHRTAVITFSEVCHVICLCGWVFRRNTHGMDEPTAFLLGREDGLTHYWSQVDAYRENEGREG